MTDQSDITAGDLDAFFAVVDQARAETSTAEAAFVTRLHAQQDQLAADMPRLLEEQLGITLPEGLRFAWTDDNAVLPRRCASEACDEYDGIHCYGDGCAMAREQG